MAEEGVRSARVARKCAEVARIIVKQEIRARVKQISAILKKPENVRTQADERVLEESPEIVESAKKRANHRQLNKQRLLEVEDEELVLDEKCHELANAIRRSKHVVIYTGAGISTAASIPDYRGPNGIWTLLGKGIQPKAQELSDADPTYTHMAISSLYKEGKVEHLVSQNCDGLHIRSGFPKERLSELHGNMYLEWCRLCNPPRQYYRLFDVTEKTALRRHATGRHCHDCDAELRDTIIHFGEKGPLCPPYRWQEAVNAVEEADMILCLGSSLKVLRKYQCLWSLHVPANKRPKLYIVNLQWTPKDDAATCKINGKCDIVVRKVMKQLGIVVPEYERPTDPLYHLATPLRDVERNTSSKRLLIVPEDLQPFQDFLHPRHRLKGRAKKRKSNPVLQKNQSNDKQRRKKPLHRENFSEEYENKRNLTSDSDTLDAPYDSDTLDAPETFEVLKMEGKDCVSQEQMDSKGSIVSVKPERTIKNGTLSVLDNADHDISAEIKAESLSQESLQTSLLTDLKTVTKLEPGSSYNTIKSLLTQSNNGQFGNLNKGVSSHTQIINNARSSSSAASSCTVSSCHGSALSIQTAVAPHNHCVPNISVANAFHSYCLLSPTSSMNTPPSGAFTSIKPLNHDSQGARQDPPQSFPSSALGFGGGIMQSLQVYKSLEDHDYCSVKDWKKDLKSDSQERLSTAHTSQGMDVPVTKPPTQKTVAELLHERDMSKAQTSLVSSNHAECHAHSRVGSNVIKGPGVVTSSPGAFKVESVRLPNSNIKIQGNVLLRQFIPSSQRPLLYATAAVVDMTRLHPQNAHVVPQMMQENATGKMNSLSLVQQTVAKTNTVPSSIASFDHRTLVTHRGPFAQTEHHFSASDLIPVMATPTIPALLSPRFTKVIPGNRPAIIAQSSHFIPSVIGPVGLRQNMAGTLNVIGNTQRRVEQLPVNYANVLSNVQVEKECVGSVVLASPEEGNRLERCGPENSTSSNSCKVQETTAGQEESTESSERSADLNLVTENEPNTPPKSAPGWFGKGFNHRKGRRKRGRLT